MDKRTLTPQIENQLKLIGDRIKAMRLEKGISYERMAYECNLNRITYYNLEKGKNFQMRTLLLVLEYHNISVKDFFIEL
jgi:transcriptional regulator with XRE-family HTH domain